MALEAKIEDAAGKERVLLESEGSRVNASREHYKQINNAKDVLNINAKKFFTQGFQKNIIDFFNAK